ncbi:unnamed protein product [Brassica oleracea]
MKLVSIKLHCSVAPFHLSLKKKTEQGSDITRPWLYENYLSSTETPVVNVTKATISAMNAFSKFPRTNRMLSRNAKLLKRNIRLAAGIQPFNKNKTVAVKHAEEHTSMRHHNSAAQGGVSMTAPRYLLLVLT